MKGLEDAEILRWAYAIEYDCAPPTQIYHSLETKKIKNLYLAGQINCTSGYEEAASQGLMAGLNVIRGIRGQAPFVLDRSEAYIGVLIDDLVTRGTSEPYRMLTSRAEFRLLLRQDNADQRLMNYGRDFGLISNEVLHEMKEKYQKINDEINLLKTKKHGSGSLHRLLRRPGVDYNYLIENNLHSHNLSIDEIRIVESEIKYEGYISRQNTDVRKFRKIEKRQIPENVNYIQVTGISSEAREKLEKIKPTTLGQASRIPGVSLCDLTLLSVHIEKVNGEL